MIYWLNKEHPKKQQHKWQQEQSINNFLCLDCFIDSPEEESYYNNKTR